MFIIEDHSTRDKHDNVTSILEYSCLFVNKWINWLIVLTFSVTCIFLTKTNKKWISIIDWRGVVVSCSYDQQPWIRAYSDKNLLTIRVWWQRRRVVNLDFGLSLGEGGRCVCIRADILRYSWQAVIKWQCSYSSATRDNGFDITISNVAVDLYITHIQTGVPFSQGLLSDESLGMKIFMYHGRSLGLY